MLNHDEINWFHSIELGDGVVTAGHKPLTLLDDEFSRLGLGAEALEGKRFSTSAATTAS